LDYLKRIVDAELDELLDGLAAVAIEGPKGVGKTETAKRRVATIIALDDPAQLAIGRAEVAQLLRAEKPILIDEWQHYPPVWDAIRRAIDLDGRPDQFLLTGSASPASPPSHSGAGRIVSLRMRPLTLSERGVGMPTVSLGKLLTGTRESIAGDTAVTLSDYVREIVSSGLPALRQLTGRASRAQLDGYLRRIVDQDFAEQGLKVRNSSGLIRWMTAYAAATATTASFETIRDAATSGQGDKPARTTVQPYREILERLWMDQEALLSGVESGPPIPRDGTLLGQLFESLVTLSIKTFAQASEARVGHLRLKGGRRDIDLIIERPDQRVVAMEIKLSSAIDQNDVKHLLWLREKIGDDLLDAVVVNTGHRAYRRKDGIAVVPAALLGP